MSLSKSPKLRLQAALWDLIAYCESEDPYGINETWNELDQAAQEQIWSFLASNQKAFIREALQTTQHTDEAVF